MAYLVPVWLVCFFSVTRVVACGLYLDMGVGSSKWTWVDLGLLSWVKSVC